MFRGIGRGGERGLWEDYESLKELIVAKLFNVAPSDQVAAMLAAKDGYYVDLRGHHIDDIFSFVQMSGDPRNPYPNLLRDWEADHFGNRREIREVRQKVPSGKKRRRQRGY